MRTYSKEEVETLLAECTERIFDQYAPRKNHGGRGKASTARHKRRQDLRKVDLLLAQLQSMETS